MKFTHSPEGQPEHDYEFEIDDLPEQDAESIEEAGGAQWDTYAEWAGLLEKGGFRAWRVLLWILQRQQNPDLDLNEVKLKTKELKFNLTEVAEQGSGKDDGANTAPDDSDTDSTSPSADTEASPSN